MLSKKNVVYTLYCIAILMDIENRRKKLKRYQDKYSLFFNERKTDAAKLIIRRKKFVIFIINNEELLILE